MINHNIALDMRKRQGVVPRASRCAAARNYKLIMHELEAYTPIKERLVREYGEPQLDDDGNETGGFCVLQGSRPATTSSSRCSAR